MLLFHDILLRAAISKDATMISKVHIQAWQEAYRDLLPDGYLKNLSSTFERRMQWWTKSTQADSPVTVFVAAKDSEVIGFCSFEKARDQQMEGFVELTAIYLLEKFKGQGIGQALLKLGMIDQIAKGYQKAYCWVLEKNPTIAFYEKSGARLHQMIKTDTIGGQNVTELAYVWDDLTPFKAKDLIQIKYDAQLMADQLGPAITDLVHRAYAPLAAKGMRYLASHQPVEKTLERLSEGESYIYFLGVRPIATITLVPTKKEDDCPYYTKPGVFFFQQFAVTPEWQGQGLGLQMMDFIEARAKEMGAKELALDTSEKADHLIKMYEARGYQFVEHMQWDVTNYRSVVLSKNL